MTLLAAQFSACRLSYTDHDLHQHKVSTWPSKCGLFRTKQTMHLHKQSFSIDGLDRRFIKPTSAINRYVKMHKIGHSQSGFPMHHNFSKDSGYVVLFRICFQKLSVFRRTLTTACLYQHLRLNQYQYRIKSSRWFWKSAVLLQEIDSMMFMTSAE